MIFAGTKKSGMKRTAAALTAAVLAAGTVTGCASSTDYSVTAGGKKINAGVYINFILNEMTQQMYTMYYTGEITQFSECLEKQVEGKDFMTYVKDKALDDTKEFAAIQAKFDELGLTLSESDVQVIESSVSSAWGSQKDYYEYQGVSRESLQMCNELSYKKDTLFEYYYSEDGVEGITNDELQKYVNENYIRYKSVAIPKSSETDEEAKNKENEELKALWEKYATEAEGLDFAGMDQLINEYETYKAEKQAEKEAAEAAAQEAAEGTEAEELSLADLDGSEQTIDVEVPENNAANEETTESGDVSAAVTTAAEESSVPDETSPAAETTTTAAETEKPAETTAAVDSSEAPAETTAPKDDAAAETTSEETKEKKSKEKETEKTEKETTAAAADEETSSDADDSTAEPADQTEVIADGAEEEETDPYANEVMTNYTEGVDASSEYYSESYAGMLKAIKETEVGKAGKYENDDYFYVFMRAEVSERTDYVPERRSTIIHSMKDTEFEQLVKGWIDAASIVVNEKAMKRYTVKEVYDRQEEYSAKQR